MQSCNGAEFIKQKTVHTPFFWYDRLIFSVEVFHFSFDKSIPSFSILKNGIFRCSILFLILLKNKFNELLNEFSKILVSKNFYNTSSSCHIGLIENWSTIFIGFIILHDLKIQLFNHFIFVFVKLLDLRDLFVFFEMIGKLLKSR